MAGKVKAKPKVAKKASVASTDPYPQFATDDYASRRKAWTSQEAEDQINAGVPLGSALSPADWLKKLGGGLFAKFLIIGRGGVPSGSGSDPSVAELKIDGIPAWDYALLYGGFWHVQSDTPEGPGKYVTTVWQANKPTYTQTDPSPVDVAAIGWAHGLNGNLDGPA